MTEPIKNCPQPDPPELVRRADGYHYRTEDEMKELTDEQIYKIWYQTRGIGTVAFCGNFARAAIAADRALNVPADRDVMRQVPEGWKLVPIEPTLDQYNSACRAYSDWQVQCQEEAREHEDERNPSWGYSQPHFTHSDVYRAMLAAVPTPPAEQQGAQKPVTTYARQHAAHEAELTAMIAERDHREEIIDQLCDAVLGQDRTEWSSNYYFEDAVAEVQERILELEERKACRDSNSPVLPASALAALRAKVEALRVWGSHFDGNGNALALILKDTVLAEIDKMGGGA